MLLIADEVINGFGRTGTMFATEQFGFVPDIMTMAKGLSSGYAPIAAAIVRDSVFDVFKENKEAVMGHLLTFGGHPAACAAALKNLEIFEEEDLVAQSAEKGEYLKQPARELRAHPTVGDVRGLGLMCGIELVKNKETRESVGQGRPLHGPARRAGAAAWSGHPRLGRDALRAAAGGDEGGDRPHGRDRRRESHHRRAGVRRRDRGLTSAFSSPAISLSEERENRNRERCAASDRDSCVQQLGMT